MGTHWTVQSGLKAIGYKIGRTIHNNFKQESNQRCNNYPSNKKQFRILLSPQNNRHLFETEIRVCAMSEGANATSEGANRGGTMLVLPFIGTRIGTVHKALC